MSIFRHKKQTAKTTAATFQPVDLTTYRYAKWDGQILEIDTIRAVIDALARACAKMDLQAVVDTGQTKAIDSRSDIARVLRRPNAYMSKYDFLYKIAAQYYINNNAFIWPEYGAGGNLVALWPINYQSVTIRSVGGRLYATFQMRYTRSYTIPYEDIIHLRGHFMDDDIFGKPNTALYPVCELINAQDQGIITGIKNSTLIRGILKTVGVIKDSDLKAAKESFVKDNLALENSSGVVAVDGKFDYTPISTTAYNIPADTIAEIKSKVYDYFGVPESFIQSNFTADQYEAVYEGKLEPYAVMLTDALTHGLYTDREIAFGNRIEAAMSRMKYQPMSAVTNVISATRELGLFTRNEYREMLGYAPLSDEEGGNQILTAVNNYSADTGKGEDDSNEVKDDDKE